MTLENTSPDWYLLMVDSAPIMMTRADIQGFYQYVSPACYDLTGYQPEELVGRLMVDFLHQDDRDRVRKACKGLAQASQTLDLRMRHKEGGYAWVRTTFVLLPRSAGSPKQAVFAFTYAIQDAKDIEAALHILARQDDLLDTHDWFRVLVSHLTNALKVAYAFITEVDSDGIHVRMLAFWKGETFGDPYAYPLEDTPCDEVINQGKVCYHPFSVQAMFPHDQDLVALNAQGYLGLPVYNLNRQVIGHIAILDNKPLKFTDAQMWLAKLFAIRAGIELERLHRKQHP